MKVLVAFFTNTFFNFVIGLMVAKFLGPAEFGRFALALAVALVTQTIVFASIPNAALSSAPPCAPRSTRCSAC